MSQPTRGDVHVNRPLTTLSIAFMNQPNDFIADKMFPVVPVAKQSDSYFVYDKRFWFRSGSKKRAPGTESAGGGFELTTDNYFADVWAFHKDIADQTRANQDQPIDLDRDGARFVTNDLMIRREKQFVDDHFKQGVWATDVTFVTKWNDPGSDPVDDILNEKLVIKQKTGFKPNKLTVTADVHIALKNNASILDRIKHTQLGSVTNALLATLFEVDEYLVAEAVEDQAKEGAAENMQFIYGAKQALLIYVPKSPGILIPSAGYHFAWTGQFGSGQRNAGAGASMRIKRFRMEKLASDRVEGEMAFDGKLVSADLGAFMFDLLT